MKIIEDQAISEADKLTIYVSKSDYKKGFKAGAEWELEETKKIMLNNFRKVCGCYVKGKCSIDCEECSFIACETLNDLIKAEKR